jgi:peptide-methionine (S)-S-oxide reductase
VKFYEAEAYHHDYAAQNPDQPYIRAVAAPKVEKMRKVYADQLKEDA